MAGFHTKTFTKHDDYMTPKSAWEAVQQYIPKDKVIWEAFYGNGDSGDYLTELGFNVIHTETDFFDGPQGEALVSNPPFQFSKKIMSKLLEYDMPFMMIMPASKICTNYFREWRDKELQIIIPRKRIQFIKLVDGKVPENYKSVCNFDCFYYCYKMNLPSDIIWLK